MVTRSNLIQSCVLLGGHNFDQVFMKLGQNVCVHKVLARYETWSSLVKKLGH